MIAGLGPLWGRQVPYTIIKFVSFERIAEKFFDLIEEKYHRPKESLNKAQQMGVVFTSGYMAGNVDQRFIRSRWFWMIQKSLRTIFPFRFLIELIRIEIRTLTLM